MAERNDLRGPLRRLDARDPRDGESVPLREPSFEQGAERRAGETDLSPGPRGAFRRLLVSDVDHPGPAAAVEMQGSAHASIVTAIRNPRAGMK